MRCNPVEVVIMHVHKYEIKLINMIPSFWEQIWYDSVHEQGWPYTENQEQEAKDGYREIFLCE